MTGCSRVNVLGVGMVPFATPKSRSLFTDMGARAVQAALQDAGIDYSEVQQAFAGYVYGDSACGQRVIYRVGMTGIPVINVNNYCATGSTALLLARQAIAGGLCDCVLAVGFEQMNPGALTSVYADRPSPMESFTECMTRLQGFTEAPRAAQFFGGAAREHLQRYGTRPDTLARIAVKARAHAANNPNAVFRDPVTVAEVLASASIFDPLTRLQCCPPTSGAAAAILCSNEFATRRSLKPRVHIAAQAMVSDRGSTFDSDSMINLVGYDMTAAAASRAFEAAGIGAKDVDVIELHDCFTSNELLSYEALGLVEQGAGEKLVVDADNTYGGQWVVNPSGGLLSKGHPLGATGLAQCAELVWQLRGQAGRRQVEGARVALQHNIGLGGACVVTLYKK
jgi:acetyl-CoA acetyltransferase